MATWEPWRHRLSAAAGLASREVMVPVKVPCKEADFGRLSAFVATLRMPPDLRYVVELVGPEHAVVEFGGEANPYDLDRLVPAHG